jgi:hypothetical protein
MAALLLTACGGGGTAAGDGAPTNAQRAEAARLTAEQNPLCSTGTLGAYYWEVGDASGTLAAGEQGGGAITGNTPMNVASASKWPFAAYVLERRGDEPALVPYLNFTSGYSEFSNLLCQSDGTLAECMNGGRNDDEAARGSFHYQGGHMQQLGVLLGLGALRNDGLGAELRSVLGAELPLAYVSPQPPGGLRTTPHAYARFLRRLLAASADPLQLGAALGRHAVCTVASDTCAAAPEGDDAAGQRRLQQRRRVRLLPLGGPGPAAVRAGRAREPRPVGPAGLCLAAVRAPDPARLEDRQRAVDPAQAAGSLFAGARRLRAPSGAITGPTIIVSSGCSSMNTMRSATRSGGSASPGIGAGLFCSHIGVAMAAGISACTLTP